MSRLFTFWIPLTAGLLAAGSVMAREPYFRMPVEMDTYPTTKAEKAAQRPPAKSSLAAYFDEAAKEDVAAANAGVKQPDCGCLADDGCGKACSEPSCECAGSCAVGCCEPSCGCDNGCCNGYGGGSCFDCCLGEPCTLQGYLQPCCDRTYAYGGWISMGYHSDFTRLSSEDAQGFSFNDRPDELNFHQVWFYTEKVAEADACSADWGYRFDILYGTDAQKTQAFGNEDNVWDVSLDHGAYGWAMPQLYGEVAYGDLKVKFGHFFTLIGYEVIPAPDNFFYSHALTMFNSEPFTHTGVIASYAVNEDVTLHGGWTLGWDTGFDQFDSGNNFLGGFSAPLMEDVTFTYMCTAGDFGWRGQGYSHSLVCDVALSDNWNYVFQSDFVDVDDSPVGVGIAGVAENTDVGINQYLFYTLNDCWKLGTRLEWWKSDAVTGESTSFYELTAGLNYKPHANVVIRPEARYDWTPAEDAVDAAIDNYNEFVFGIDAIFTY